MGCSSRTLLLTSPMIYVFECWVIVRKYYGLLFRS